MSKAEKSWEISGAGSRSVDFRTLTGISSGRHRLADLIDPITRLPNRLGMEGVLGDLLPHLAVDASVAVIQVKIEDLKLINGSIGYGAGDSVLLEAGHRLFNLVSNRIAVGRTGSSEFVVLVAGGLAAAVRQVQASFQAPFLIGGKETEVSVTLGTSLFPDDAVEPATLLQNCDLAMAQARGARHGHQRFRPEMRDNAAARIDLQRRMRNALRKGEFQLAYQPLTNARSGLLVGSEALLRWNEGGNGAVAPSVFIPAAEEGSLIVSMSAWVLDQACQQAKAWRNSGLASGAISVNISARHFYAGSLVADVRNALARSGLAADLLTIEITESTVLDESRIVVETLNELVKLGVRLSLDDFGTGYSSLSYLSKFPFDSLKIDQSFIRDMASSRRSMALVKSIVAMARSLDGVIAESSQNRTLSRIQN